MTTTPLHQFNLEHGARLVNFGGWQMPVQYESVLVEHRTVRRSAGFFDVSHLGRFSLKGKGSRAALDRLLCNNLNRVEPGRAQYTMLLNPEGGIVDDLIVWWWEENEYWLMPNAVNQPVVMGRFAREPHCEVTDLQTSTAMIAIQGPDAPAVIESVIERKPGRFRTERFQWGGGPVWMAGTGYTGERGGELVTDPATAEKIASALVRHGVRPCGLGARDTLRLEAGFPLWGEDIDETTTPLEADLGFAVDLDHEFVGGDVLRAQLESGVSKRLSGFVLDDRGIPRHGYAVRTGDSKGTVTSGNMSPMLEKGIGMAYLSPPPSEGANVGVEIRNRWVEGKIVKPPFV